MSRPIPSGVVVALAALAATGLTRTASAQNADAEALFSEADGLEASGRLAEACDAFEASNRIEPRAGTMIRLGACREAQGRLASAWSAFKDALTRVKDEHKRQLAEQRVAALEPRLSYLIVSVPDESRLDGLVVLRNGVPLDPGLWNRAAPVDGGPYVIEGRAPGHEAWRTTVELDTSDDRAAVEVPRFKALRLLAPSPVAGVGPIDGATGARPRRRIALGMGAGGVAALATGVVLALQARGLEHDAYARCPDPAVPCTDAAEAQSLVDRADSRATFANVALGAGVLALGGATVLWLTAGRESRRPGVSIIPRAAAGSASLDVTGRF